MMSRSHRSQGSAKISGDVVLATFGDDAKAKDLTASLARAMRCLVQSAILDSSHDFQYIGGLDLVDLAIADEWEDQRLERPHGLGVRGGGELLLLDHQPLARDRFECIRDRDLLGLSTSAGIYALCEKLPGVIEFLSRELRRSIRKNAERQSLFQSIEAISEASQLADIRLDEQRESSAVRELVWFLARLGASYCLIRKHGLTCGYHPFGEARYPQMYPHDWPAANGSPQTSAEPKH